MRLLLLIFLCYFSFSSFSFGQLDRYEFIVVPTKFDILFEPNAYRTSTLIKYLLSESGYTVYYENELSEYALQNPCKGVRVDLEENSGLLLTKIQLLFKNCRNQLVFKSFAGESKSKDYKEAYHESIRQAFSSVLSGKGVTSSEKEPTKSSAVERLRLVFNGGEDYALVDFSGTVVFRLKKSAAPDVYLLTSNEISGLLFKESSGKWALELTDGTGTKVTTYPEIEE